MRYIGFIGLGNMGRGMALNILRSGSSLVVYDSNAEAVEALVAEGAAPATSVGDLTRRADVIFTSLPGPREFEAVVLSEDGVAANLRPGTVHFDLSTNDLELVRHTFKVYADRDCSFLDAPISGGPSGAASGDLVVWAGGDKGAFNRCSPILQMFAREPRLIGEIGAGTVTKLAHNMLGYMIMHSETEVFSMAACAGVDPLDLWEALKLGMVGKSSPLDMLTKQFLPGKYEPPAFALKLAHKDVTLAAKLARDVGVPMRMASLTLAEMTEALAQGMGDLDSRSYLQLQLNRAGVRFSVESVRLGKAIERARG